MVNRLVGNINKYHYYSTFSSVVRNNNILWTDVRETFYRKTDTSTFFTSKEDASAITCGITEDVETEYVLYLELNISIRSINYFRMFVYKELFFRQMILHDVEMSATYISKNFHSFLLKIINRCRQERY